MEVLKKITLSSFNSPNNTLEERFANDNRDVENLATYEFTIRSRRNRDLNIFQRVIILLFHHLKGKN